MRDQIIMAVSLKQEDKDMLKMLSKHYRQNNSSTIRRLILEKAREEGFVPAR